MILGPRLIERDKSLTRCQCHSPQRSQGRFPNVEVSVLSSLRWVVNVTETVQAGAQLRSQKKERQVKRQCLEKGPVHVCAAKHLEVKDRNGLGRRLSCS